MELKRGGEISISIDDFAFGGKGITKIQTEEGNYVIFTQNGIPGQKVNAKIIKKKKSFAECRILQVIEKSPLEKPTEFQSISGAPYISLPIEKQHEFKLDSTFELFKISDNIQKLALDDKVDLVYYDAFGPRVQADLWNEKIFSKISNVMKPESILVTYCAKGELKRILKRLGFIVETLPGPPGKREMVRAKKIK